MKKIRNWLVNNIFFQTAYKVRFYLNLGIAQISWFTGKLPEVMAFVYLTEWLGMELSQDMLFVFFIGTVFGLTLIGYVWKKTGLYDTEIFVNTSKNPVTMEILNAARTINKYYGGNKNAKNLRINVQRENINKSKSQKNI